MAEDLMLFKYVVKSVARAAGHTATFMTEPVFQDNGVAFSAMLRRLRAA